MRPTPNKQRFHAGGGPGQPDAAFICEHCNQCVPGAAPGTEHRNHCPHCLWSLHVDMSPGDRRCGCRGQMEPIAIWVRPGGEWAIVHRCRRCNCTRINRIAGDDNELVLLSLALRPLAQPPFPLDGMALAARASKQSAPDVNDIEGARV
jgi:hypothetical protein